MVLVMRAMSSLNQSCGWPTIYSPLKAKYETSVVVKWRYLVNNTRGGSKGGRVATPPPPQSEVCPQIFGKCIWTNGMKN